MTGTLQSESYVAFIAALRAIRLERGISQAQLADALNRPQSLVSKTERESGGWTSSSSSNGQEHWYGPCRASCRNRRTDRATSNRLDGRRWLGGARPLVG